MCILCCGHENEHYREHYRLTSLCRFTTFDGSSVQHTNLGAYTLYDEPAGPSVIVEQAPCSKMTACVYRVILTYSADILVFDLTSPNVGIKVVNNGAEIFVHSETALANGLLFSRQTLTQFTVRSSNDDFKLEVGAGGGGVSAAAALFGCCLVGKIC